jgi:putative toxin-antitoxin system antitoxin component (TIGR02293 family)
MTALPAIDPADQDVGRTAELLGGRHVLHRALRNRLDAHDLLADGLPARALDHLVHKVTILRLRGSLEKAVGISPRTYQRRKDDLDRVLSPEQSGRTWKFAELLARAITVFGTQEAAEAWFERPAVGLDQRRPIDLLSTPAGVETIEDHLMRLEYGVYA